MKNIKINMIFSNNCGAWYKITIFRLNDNVICE